MVLWVEKKEFEETFEETVSLLTAVKSRVENNIEHKKIVEPEIELNNEVIDEVVDEMKVLSNLTVSLTSIMSWLILNKAFNAGEIGIEDLKKEGRSILEIINKQDFDKSFAKNFGNNIGDLIARSRRLFGSIKELTDIVENHKV